MKIAHIIDKFPHGLKDLLEFGTVQWLNHFLKVCPLFGCGCGKELSLEPFFVKLWCNSGLVLPVFGIGRQ